MILTTPKGKHYNFINIEQDDSYLFFKEDIAILTSVFTGEKMANNISHLKLKISSIKSIHFFKNILCISTEEGYKGFAITIKIKEDSGNSRVLTEEEKTILINYILS